PPAQPSRSYTVRLHFAELDQVKPGERVFDVRIQNKTVIQGLDVVSEAGGCRTALTREIEGISASDTITIGLLPSADSKLPAILSAIEIAQDQ
ncbi:MAG TPA: malectin domain-containing carbohydrate-binding protein, partial [Pirellulales bacterium]|nr:malectin domain-containing carbohydrate-binding protein [Pirellulales bacterium]